MTRYVLIFKRICDQTPMQAQFAFRHTMNQFIDSMDEEGYFTPDLRLDWYIANYIGQDGFSDTTHPMQQELQIASAVELP